MIVLEEDSVATAGVGEETGAEGAAATGAAATTGVGAAVTTCSMILVSAPAFLTLNLIDISIT